MLCFVSGRIDTPLVKNPPGSTIVTRMLNCRISTESASLNAVIVNES